MIRTGYKKRIPSTWSFAVAAKNVSEALAGVPQYSKLTLFFRHSRQVLADWKTWERSLTAITLCEVTFRWYSPTVATPNILLKTEPVWAIEVEAVPREQKPRVARLIKDQGLARMRQWLEPRGALDVGDRNQGPRLTFDPREEKILYEEWQRP